MPAPTTQPLDGSSRRWRFRHWIWRQNEAVTFWALALLYLIPVWAFHYLPTQDGPSHLANAQLLKDYGHSAAGFEAFFELRAEPMPNWTSHLLLAGMLYLVPPLVAEKLLVSLYVLGFAGAFRYFLGAFGERCRPLSLVGLLFVYNRCFWLGFWNYCLSLILFWVILGYCLRRRGTLHLPQAALLMLLFTADYFTHLAGFLLAFAGALGAAVLVRPRRVLGPVLICVAALPPACLVLDYFERTGFFEARAARHLFDHPPTLLHGDRRGTGLVAELTAVDQELFKYHAGSSVPFSLLVAFPFILLAVCVLRESGRRTPEESAGPGRVFPFLLGLLLLGVYLLLPDHLGFDQGVLRHGGFLKARLALLPPLLWLACLPEPARPVVRWLFRSVTVLLLGVNLVLVGGAVRLGNLELERYAAGIEAVGRGQRLVARQADPRPTPLVNPLLHAADYYCQGTANVNLDNYEARTPHFPVKYRRGGTQGRNWALSANQDAADVMICWAMSPGGGGRDPAGWEEVFRQGPLRIYRRPRARRSSLGGNRGFAYLASAAAPPRCRSGSALAGGKAAPAPCSRRPGPGSAA
jgi:hypothetical protein